MLQGQARARWGWLLAVAAGAGAALAGCAAQVGPSGDPMDPPDEPPAIALPDCAGRLAHVMWDALEPVADHGTIPLDRIIAVDAELEEGVYVSGPEIFPRMAELVAEARVEVAMEFYKWEPGTDATETILGGLAAVQARRIAEGDAGPPVAVYLVIDTSPLGIAAPPAAEIMPLIVEQMAAYRFDPAHLRITLAANERKASNVVANIHVKSVVVDGRIGMLTGANPEAQHDFATPWHDTGWVMGGPLVAGLLADFDFSWARSVLWTCGADDARGQDCTAPLPPVDHQALPAEPLDGSITVCDALLLSRAGAAFPNNEIDNPQDQAMLAGFAAAARELHLETPNLNDDAAKAALLDAAARGIDVRIILAKGFNDGSEQLAGGTNVENVAELYATLAERGLERPCERLQIRWYSHDGVAPVVGNGPWANHTKYTAIDGELLVFGEMNMDTPSWNFSHELNVAVDDGFFTGLIERRFFLPDWESAIPVEECGGP